MTTKRESVIPLTLTSLLDSGGCRVEVLAALEEAAGRLGGPRCQHAIDHVVINLQFQADGPGIRVAGPGSSTIITEAFLPAQFVRP